jgi:high-affinity K+ transport system ATPase subunit B
MGDVDLGPIIGLISVATGAGVIFAAFAGAYFFGKSRAQDKSLRSVRDPELMQRIERIEQVVEATAIEIERISEGQRFTTRLLRETKAVEPK